MKIKFQEWKENKSVSDKTRSKDDPPVAVVNNKVKDASNKGANGKKKPKEKKKGLYVKCYVKVKLFLIT